MSEQSWCSKHGSYDADFTINTESYTIRLCPKCTELTEKDICVECEKHKATMNYSDSGIEWAHFGPERICHCCYLKRVEEAYNNVKQNYERLLAENKTCEVV